MSVSRRPINNPQRGVTLIELIMFIVIVSVGLAGVLASLNISVKSSADPMQTKQALAIAEGLLEEILLKGYCDPDTITANANPAITTPVCGANGSEARSAFDAAQDFDAVGGVGTAISTDAAGNPWPTGYSPTVTVTDTTLGPAALAALQIEVSVAYPGGTISLTGYRANY